MGCPELTASLKTKEREQNNFRKKAHRFGLGLFDLKPQKLKE